jgi:histidyl-tRNA synthetase
VGTPGVGFGAGVERILLACDAEGVLPAEAATADVFVVDTAGGQDALLLSAELRDAGIAADRAYDGRSMKAQMKAADRSGASLALIVGADEAAANEVTVRSLRGERGEQVRVPRDKVVDYVREHR